MIYVIFEFPHNIISHSGSLPNLEEINLIGIVFVIRDPVFRIDLLDHFAKVIVPILVQLRGIIAQNLCDFPGSRGGADMLMVELTDVSVPNAIFEGLLLAR